MQMAFKHTDIKLFVLSFIAACLATLLPAPTVHAKPIEASQLHIQQVHLSSAPLLAVIHNETVKRGRCKSEMPPLKLPRNCEHGTLASGKTGTSDRSRLGNEKSLNSSVFPTDSPELILRVTGPPHIARGSPAPFWDVFSRTMSMLK